MAALSPLATFGVVGLAAGVAYLVYKSVTATTTVEEHHDAGGDHHDAGGDHHDAGGDHHETSDSTVAENTSALSLFAQLPSPLDTSAKNALLSNDTFQMRTVANGFDVLVSHAGTPGGYTDAQIAIIDKSAQVLRGRAMALDAKPGEGKLSLFPHSPKSVLVMANGAHMPSDWWSRFPKTHDAVTTSTGFGAGVVKLIPEYDDASVKHLLDGIYIVGDQAYFVGDARTMPGTTTVDATLTQPPGWSGEGAIAGLYMPTKTDIRSLRDALGPHTLPAYAGGATEVRAPLAYAEIVGLLEAMHGFTEGSPMLGVGSIHGGNAYDAPSGLIFPIDKEGA
jgi:hypothetical protein